MKIILTAPVANLGIAGDVVEVKDGYARNFLLPTHKAIAYNRGTASQIEGIKRSRDAKQIRDNEHAIEIREQIEGLSVMLSAPADDNGKLYGGVTPNTIATAIKKAGGPALDKRAIKTPKPVKTVGAHQVAIRLTDAVVAHLTIQVAAA